MNLQHRLLNKKINTWILDHAQDDNREKGFSPIIIVGVVLVLSLFVFLFFFFKQNNQQLKESVASDIPQGVVVDADGNICETQDKDYCHESVDVETWKDDRLP